MKKDIFKVGGKSLKSRLIVGTGKYKSLLETAKAVKASGASMVTVAVRRVNILDKKNGVVLQSVSENNLQSSNITKRITDVFEHFASKRAEVSANSRRAQDSEVALQDILITLEEDMSEIRDADLASLITQLEFLMTQKDAAQATFTRVTGKTLFDLIG